MGEEVGSTNEESAPTPPSEAGSEPAAATGSCTEVTRMEACVTGKLVSSSRPKMGVMSMSPTSVSGSEPSETKPSGARYK